jgi:hypothetical protein
MDYDAFLMLKKDTQSLMHLLFTLRRYYSKHSHQKALKNIEDCIITSSNSLIMINIQLGQQKNAA